MDNTLSFWDELWEKEALVLKVNSHVSQNCGLKATMASKLVISEFLSAFFSKQSH